MAQNNKNLRKKIEKYIRENPKTSSIEELAENLGYSRIYTGRLVKRLTGASFKQLLQSVRLGIAAKKLRSTNKKICEIIAECGYVNESFFRRIFKKEFEITPHEYRRENSKK